MHDLALLMILLIYNVTVNDPLEMKSLMFISQWFYSDTPEQSRKEHVCVCVREQMRVFSHYFVSDLFACFTLTFL